ncbi:hypothetical protein M9H77_12121 [Catharanthus roseus]|uniref:Uncharacterized protein n=1 Tax=Catharanthus roseus TaxID=4058 RepID=A0ACC0BGP0_CATRO|nr:hypothetical protein M9H77_12121 [Catharanthus roseus]
MQAYILLGPTAIDRGGSSSSNRNLVINPWSYCYWEFNCRSGQPRFLHRRPWSSVIASASLNGQKQNHYSVLGVSSNASPSDIKKAYRLLALKYHPDVSKESGADETFKSIRLAYDILSNETSRSQYDRTLLYERENSKPLGGQSWDYDPEYEDELRIYRWAYLRRKMQYEKYWQQNQSRDRRYSFYDKSDEESPDDATEDEERGSFIEVLKSAFLTLFLMQTVGIRLSLTFSSLMAFFDKKLDAGYKIGYLMAWTLGGRGGILLTLCLSFASWVCGKTSSSLVALVVVAMWFGSNLARLAPVPQGALLALLYMSIKLQIDVK